MASADHMDVVTDREAPTLSDAQAERLATFLTGVQVLLGASAELLIARGVLPEVIAARRFHDDPITRLLDLDAPAQRTFWLLVEELHTARVGDLS